MTACASRNYVRARFESSIIHERGAASRAFEILGSQVLESSEDFWNPRRCGHVLVTVSETVLPTVIATVVVTALMTVQTHRGQEVKTSNNRTFAREFKVRAE